MGLASECGLSLKENTPNGVCFTVKEEGQAHALMKKMLEAGVPPIKFELREPTLNEIFIERVERFTETEENGEKGEEKNEV